MELSICNDCYFSLNKIFLLILLSAICFLVTHNKFPNTLPLNVKCLLYSDDLIIYIHSGKYNHLEDLLNTKKLKNWTSTTGFRLLI